MKMGLRLMQETICNIHIRSATVRFVNVFITQILATNANFLKLRHVDFGHYLNGPRMAIHERMDTVNPSPSVSVNLKL